MTTATVDKASIAVEIAGKPYFVLFPEDRLSMLMKMVAAMCDDNTLKVVPAPDGFSFKTIKDLQEQ